MISDRESPASPLLAAASENDLARIPAIVTEAGPAARFAWEEFLFGRIRNDHTRRAYRRAILSFLDWCDDHGLKLHQIAIEMSRV